MYLLVCGRYLACCEYLLLFGKNNNEKGAQMICEEREGDRTCEMVSFTLEFFFYSSTALLPFAVSLITHGLLLLRSPQKKYYFISGFSLQHLYFIISSWVSYLLVLLTLPFSSGVSVLKNWCQRINFTSSREKKNLSPNQWFIL